MKKLMVLMLAAMALLTACGDAGDGGNVFVTEPTEGGSQCDDGVDCNQNVVVNGETDDGNDNFPKPNQTEPMCELSLAMGQTGNLELWVVGLPEAASLTMGCWEGGPCNLYDVSLNPQPYEDAQFVVITGYQTGVLRTLLGGWIDASACDLLDGIVWKHDPNGGYLWWPNG